MSPLAKARFWLLDYAYAVEGQVRGVLDRTDPAVYRTGTEEPVLLIPGIWETWRFLRPLAEHLHAAGHPVHVLAALGWNGTTVEASAALARDHLVEHDLRDVIVVAHSKGGLIGKYLMLFDDPEGRVRRMVAVATPFSGSEYARYTPLPSLRAFSPDDATTVLLGANHDVNERITSIFGSFDPHIPGGSALPWATNVRLPVAGHFRILSDPGMLAALDRALARPVSRPEPPAR
jgi:triacylglycerol lipase